MQNEPQGRHIHERKNKQTKKIYALELAGARPRNAMHAKIWGRRSKEYFLYVTPSAPLKFAQRQLRNKAGSDWTQRGCNASDDLDYSRVACVAICDIRHDRSRCKTVTSLSLYQCTLHLIYLCLLVNRLRGMFLSKSAQVRFRCQTDREKIRNSFAQITTNRIRRRKRKPHQICINLNKLRF